VGYCQGLNFVAGVLLLHGDEASAFALLCLLCAELLPGYHTPAMRGLHAAQDVVTAALRLYLPTRHARLVQAQVPVREHSTQWLLCLYINVLPLASALRLWDLLFDEVRCQGRNPARQLVTLRPRPSPDSPGLTCSPLHSAQGAAVLLRAPAAILAVQGAARGGGQEAARGGGQEADREATQGAAQGHTQAATKTSLLRFTKPAKALAASAAAQGAAQEVARPATDDGSDRSEGCEVHAAFCAAFRLGGEPLIRAVLARLTDCKRGESVCRSASSGAKKDAT